MLLFNNINFNNIEVNYLSFDKNFTIKVDKSNIKLILGPNGIGKSSIYRNIQINHPEFSYLDYDKIEKNMIKNKKNLVIASKIVSIEEKQKEKQNILEKLNLSNSFKIFDLTSETKCKTISSNLNNYRKDIELAINKFSDDKLDNLFSLDNDLKGFIVKYCNNLIEQANEEINIEEIKDNYRKKCLEIVNNYLNDDETVCPVCGSECNRPIKNIIKESLSKIKESTNKIVNDYISSNPNISPNLVLEKITKLKNKIIDSKITIETIENYIICGGSKETAKLIIQNKNKINQLSKEITILEKEKNQFYLNIKNIENRIRDVFEGQLDIPFNNIKFDDSKKELNITLTRDISKYSTGEINLITFVVTMLEFINSDADTLIIDDPLSSYDLPNQYKIMYEITNVNFKRNFNILVFTHNIDCINIANSQYNSAYSIELLDQINGKLYLNPIINMGDSGFNIDYLNDNLTKYNKYQYIEYIKLLSEKDKWKSNNLNHQLFHYDSLYFDSNNKCSNKELAGIIDNFNCENVKNDDAIINSSNKIIYLAALRVWIEKQFYDNNDNPDGLKKEKSLGNKIRFMLDKNHWTGKVDIKKDFLMSKKVMLNQNDHADSQKEPFYYALSISTDDIIKDVLAIRKHFSK